FIKVVADVLDRWSGTVAGEPAWALGDEDPGVAPSGDGEDVVGERTGSRDEVHGQWRNLLGLESPDQGPEDVLGEPRPGDRGDDVRRDPVLRAFHGENAGQPDEPHFGRAVVGLAEVAVQPGRGTRKEEASVSLRLHHPEGGLGHEERAEEMDVENGLKILGREVREGFIAEDPGVVDDNVDGAEGVESLLDNRRSTFWTCDGVHVGDGLAAGGADDLNRVGGGSRSAAGPVGAPADVVDDDPGSPAGEFQRVGSAEAAPGSGDDGDLAIKIDWHGGRPPRALADF